MSKYKSQIHLLDGDNDKFSALGFSPLDIKTGIVIQKSQIQMSQGYTPDILRVAVTTKTTTFS